MKGSVTNKFGVAIILFAIGFGLVFILNNTPAHAGTFTLACESTAGEGTSFTVFEYAGGMMTKAGQGMTNFSGKVTFTIKRTSNVGFFIVMAEKEGYFPWSMAHKDLENISVYWSSLTLTGGDVIPWEIGFDRGTVPTCSSRRLAWNFFSSLKRQHK